MRSLLRQLTLAAVSTGALMFICSSVVGLASGATTPCQIRNASIPGSSYSDLQAAVNGASSGNTLVIRGTCVGTATIGIDLTLTGIGHAKLDGQQAGSVITIPLVTPEPRVTINSLTITGGSASGISNSGGKVVLNWSIVTGNTGQGSGGGIWNGDGGTVILNNTTVSKNIAANAFSSFGGGIANAFGSTVVLNGRSRIAGNSSSGLDGDQYGGGIGNDGKLVMNGQSTISGNHAGKFGGGVENASTLVMNGHSSIRGNTVGYAGGGVDNGELVIGGTVTLNDHSSIAGNTAGQQGGGIANVQSTVTMKTHSTITGNHVTDTVSGHGGGIFNYGTLNGAIAGGNVYGNTPDDIS